YVPWHHSVAAPAHRHVERRSRPAAIGQTGGEPDLLDEPFGVERGLDLARPLAAPLFIAVLFNLRGNLCLQPPHLLLRRRSLHGQTWYDLRCVPGLRKERHR